MKLGDQVLERLRAETDGLLLPGDEIIAVGYIGLDGTGQQIREQRERLGKRFSNGFLKEAEEFCAKHSLSEKDERWDALQGISEKYGRHALLPLGEGGFLAGLWILAEASGTGLRADLRKVPVLQHTIEICEVLALHPYQLMSRGAYLAGVPSGLLFVSELQREGIPAAVIGQAETGNDRLLISGSGIRYLDRPPREIREKYRETEK